MLSRIIFYKSFCNLLKTERRLILNIFEKNGKKKTKKTLTTSDNILGY